jgi:predicted TPR repeat methyltransferase
MTSKPRNRGAPDQHSAVRGAEGDLPAAIAELRRAFGRAPDSGAAAFALACAWLDAGEPDPCIGLLRRLASGIGPYRKRAAAKLREAEDMKALSRFPGAYVRHLFDQFSASYDHVMLRDLGYRAPQILHALAEMLMVGSEGPLDILDLGCGTGLAGKVFKTLAQRLDGVDLSPMMIERARAGDVYDRLVVDDIENFLEGSRRKYDLLIAADTLVYFGDLSRLFGAARAILNPNGRFLFTAERQAGVGFSLGPKRRYRHSAEYLRAAAESADLKCIGMLDCSPRLESGQPVEGLATAFQRSQP